jgi:hypothetical protein
MRRFRQAVPERSGYVLASLVVIDGKRGSVLISREDREVYEPGGKSLLGQEV